MLIELLRPAGPEVARRWLAALMLVDSEEREAMVAMVERQIAQLYGPGARREEPAGFQVVHPPVQRDGHTEQIVTTYEVIEEKPAREEPGGHQRHLRRAR